MVNCFLTNLFGFVRGIAVDALVFEIHGTSDARALCRRARRPLATARLPPDTYREH